MLKSGPQDLTTAGNEFSECVAETKYAYRKDTNEGLEGFEEGMGNWGDKTKDRMNRFSGEMVHGKHT